ncbi:MAG: LuxR C-terminal-related transcriptional regulator [Caldilineaceae bacterium]
MSTPILATKLYIPPPRPNLVSRPRLIAQLHESLHRKLTLISAPAGFGKTTLVSSWISDLRLPISDFRGDTVPAGQSVNRQSKIGNQVAWLALDEEDRDPFRFLAYFVAALQTVVENVGKQVMGALQAPQPPPLEVLLTMLINEMVALPHQCVLILDDYHVLDSSAVDQALTFLLEHLPPQLHLVITTREDPPLPLARLRARAQLTEVRAADLRFTPDEAADFLTQVMGLDLTAAEVGALEARTEGWIAGLQLAAISLQAHHAGDHDLAGFIQSFTGSHRFVMDYLLEEVLHQQPEHMQAFLLYTSILDRMCGPLCDAIIGDWRLKTDDHQSPVPNPQSQTILESLEQANLFMVPLDNERRWYRYHHLFGELLRQRLHQHLTNTGKDHPSIAELHIRASQWYEENGLELEAFHHATAADDVARAERLIEGGGMPLHFRGVVLPVLHWLQSLPTHVLDTWPSLWTAYASTLLVTGQTSRVEEKLQAAEAVLQRAELDDKTRDLIGRVAAIRATAAANQRQVEAIITHSRQALAYLHPDNLAFRTSTNWKLGFAYHLQGNYAAAAQAYQEVITTGQATGNLIFTSMATIGLGGIQEAAGQLDLAAQSYQRALALFGEHPLPAASEAYLGLARISYERNDLVAAQAYVQQSIGLAHQLEQKERLIPEELLRARLHLAQGDVAGANALVTKIEQFARQRHMMHHRAEIAAVQVLVLLAQGRVAAAQAVAQTYQLPLSQVRAHLAQSDAAAAWAILEPMRQKTMAMGRTGELLKVMALQAVTYQMQGEMEPALQRLGEALTLAAAGGYIRLFVDEGLPMAHLLQQLLPRAATHGVAPESITQLLALLAAEGESATNHVGRPTPVASPPLPEPLSERETEVLHLIAAGYKNQEIADELVVSLNTVRYHTKNLYGKLGVNKRTQAVAKAQELGLL